MSYPPPHYLHIYQRPKQDTTSASIPKRLSKFIRSFPALNYQHRVSCMGWFDTAVCDVRVHDLADGLMFLEQYIASSVRIIVDNPAEPAWEGFINRMIFTLGRASITISLDEMGNRVTVKYTDPAVISTPVPSSTAAVNQTTSQAVYGIKQSEMEFGYARNTTSTAMATLAASLLANQSFPKSSLRVGNGKFSVRVEMLGWYHTLKWEVYNSGVDTSATAISTLITGTILPALANGKTFFDNTDMGLITTNTVTFPAQQRSGGTFWDILQKMAEIGNGSTGFIVGIMPTNYQTRERRLYYKAINLTTEYTINMRRGLYFQTLYRKRVPPWLVRPDRGVLVEDWLLRYGLPGDDPRYSYVYDVSYDANNQAVSFNSQDDTTLEGAFDLKRSYQRYGKKFGAKNRVAEG